MYRFYKASKDASIYSIQPNQNTGRDEILEISKTEITTVATITPKTAVVTIKLLGAVPWFTELTKNFI